MSEQQTQMTAIDHDVMSKKESEDILKANRWRQVGTNRSERISGTKLSSLARTLGMNPKEISRPNIFWTEDQSTFEDPQSGNTTDVIDLQSHEQPVRPLGNTFSGPVRSFSSLSFGSPGRRFW